MFNIGREREKERHASLSIFHRKKKKNLSPSLLLLLDPFFLAFLLYKRKEKRRREIFAFSLSLSFSIARSVVYSNELQDSYMLYVLRPNKWRNPWPMSTQKRNVKIIDNKSTILFSFFCSYLFKHFLYRRDWWTLVRQCHDDDDDDNNEQTISCYCSNYFSYPCFTHLSLYYYYCC